MDINQIDTRHGAFNHKEFSNGNTLPYTGVPFGMNYFTVQNKENTPWYFDPSLPIFQGIRLTHQPSPWMGDFSSILYTPISGDIKDSDLVVNQSSYNINNADFNPHYLSLNLLRYQIDLKIVPSSRGAIFKLNGPKNKKISILISADSNLNFKVDYESKKLFTKMDSLINSGKSNLSFYTVMDFSNLDISVAQIEENSIRNLKSNKKYSGKNFLVSFSEDKFEFSLGTSFISLENAELNLKREILDYNASDLLLINEKKWTDLLDKIEVFDKNSNKVLLFYQCMYRTLLFPQSFYEYNICNEPVHYDIYNNSISKGKYYINIGYWDAYRTLLPLFSIVLPDMYKNILEGIANFYKATTHLPKWLSPDERGMMPGTHVSAVIADAAVKGLMSEEEMNFFLNALIKEATIQSNNKLFGRRGISDTEKYGYVTSDEEGSVNQTLDNAYSDFCISQIANLLNKKEIADYYESESLKYRNLYDYNTGFIRGKDKNSKFIEPFSPYDWSREYIEASPWVSSLAIFHNISDFIYLFDGKENFEDHLIKLANSEPIFELSKDGMEYNEVSEMAVSNFGQLAISNQPGFHLPYLYSYVGKPEYTEIIVKQICENLFSNSFDGYPGDEDNGSLSAWYIFNTIGFYPVTPGTGEYVIGLPQFDKVILRLPNKQSFIINVKNNLPQNQFIKDQYLNEVLLKRLYISHDEILNGGELKFNLSLLPSRKDFTSDQIPYSLNKEIKINSTRGEDK